MMSEITNDAMILISISFQALKRAERGNKSTFLCDCTVIIAFAIFFIEANLNGIIDELQKNDEINKFFGYDHPGLRDKLIWFYNEYVASEKVINKNQLVQQEINEELEKEFPGFSNIYDFRNNIAHGVINESQANLENASQLRIKAKEIVNKLFVDLSKKGVDIHRNINYDAAISRLYDSPQDDSFDNGIRLVFPSS